MDIVDFFTKQTEAHNTYNKCGLCFEFSAPMFLSDLNVVQSEKPCCVQVMLTDVSSSIVRQYSPTIGYETGKVIETNFTLYVLMQSRMDINNHNEMKGHPTSEGKWEAIWKPLQECFSDKTILNFCSILGYNVKVPKWTMTMERNYQDNNFDGWKIMGTFREEEF